MSDRELVAEEILFTEQDSSGDGGSGVTTRVIVIEVSQNNVNLRTLYDQFYVPPVGGETVICTIGALATVGSTSTSTPAFDVGSWPASVSITIRNSGRIQGKGGDGGSPGTDIDGDFV